MCRRTLTVLCIQNLLSNIVKVAKEVHEMANEIEDKIVNMI